MSEKVDLARKYRPGDFAHMFGQKTAVKMLHTMIQNESVPHALLFSGPSGVGKTTAARIMARCLGCRGADLREINCASVESPIDVVRDIEKTVCFYPRQGVSWVFIMDEFQSLSRANSAQQALLKIMEEPPDNTYFILCTTDTSKIIDTIVNRCTKVAFRALSDDEIKSLVSSVAQNEHAEPAAKIISKIVESAGGSARKALTLYQKTISAGTDENALDLVSDVDEEAAAFDIVKALLYERLTWDKIAPVVVKCRKMDQESLRHFVLACTTTELLKNNRNSGRAFTILEAFRDTWRDCGESGLAVACFEVLNRGSK